MLVRFVVKNLLSFSGLKEFNTIPNGRLQTLKHHKYQVNGFDLLKMSSIYGANGAGKSNLVKAVSALKGLVVGDLSADDIYVKKFKFIPENEEKAIVLAIEFIQDGCSYYYAVELINNRVKTEELYLSGLGKKDDNLVFERNTDEEGLTNLKFSDDFESDAKNKMLVSLIIEEFVDPEKTLIKFLANRENKNLECVRSAFKWFDKTLVLLDPKSKPTRLSERLEKDSALKSYIEELMKSFDVGITSFTTNKVEFKKMFSEEDKHYFDKIKKDVDKTKNKEISLFSESGDEIYIYEENGKLWAKELKCCHEGICNNEVLFDLDEESDGTVRLLHFAPAFKDLVKCEKVYIVDEIERSIHPLLIKFLIEKFSLDKNTKGQLIFTTHESNLLDQKIFRRDEIWFAEKDKNGASDLYSLSDFKEHQTIDIQKGYLNGRYGSIPFLGNLKDLDWN